MKKQILKTSSPQCYYHHQPIEWFCLHSRCLMPICKLCQPIHEQKHKNKVTVMKLVPITECLTNAQHSIKKLLAPLKKSCEQYQDIIAKKMESMQTSLEESRIRILAEIAKQYDAFATTFMVSFKEGFQKTRLKLDEQVLQMERKLLHLQIPELSMKAFIEYYRDEDATYRYIEEISKKVVKAEVVVPVLNNSFNVQKWVRVKRVKHHEAWLEEGQPYSTHYTTEQEGGGWGQHKDDGDSEEEENMEERLKQLKEQNDKLIMLLRNGSPAA